MKHLACMASLSAVIGLAAFGKPANDQEDDKPVSGDAIIRRKAGPSEIVITTTSRVAGAIHSLRWNGKEFVDSTDHGRQIQSASNFDCRMTFVPEVFNPTEAGSLSDGAGPTSSSRLLELKASDNRLSTRTRMAFWLRPGEKSQGHPARNTAALSEHILAKDVTIGYKTLAHAIEYNVTFFVPMVEQHTFAQFEAVTGYMPAEFQSFHRFDRRTKALVRLSDGPGEQADPVVLSTEDGAFAMGVYSPDQPSKGFEAAGYGRFKFRAEKVVKWNCVFRVRDAKNIPGGEYRYRCFLVVGDRVDCETTIRALSDLFAN
jgi:hypothetical protein